MPPLFHQAVLTPSPPAATAAAAALPQPPALIVVPEKSLPLGRAISDPQVLRRELDRGIQAMEGIAEVCHAACMGTACWQAWNTKVDCRASHYSVTCAITADMYNNHDLSSPAVPLQ